MARAVWSGSLTFGLVTLPVQLATATDSHTIRFHQLERGTSDRVRNKRVNERTGEEVPYDKIVKGYDTGEEYVIVEPGELDEITPGRSQAIEITGFVELDAIEPAYFDSTYYLQPRKEHANVYGLLRDALSETGRAGIATMSMRQKDYLVAVHEQSGVLVMHTLHWADEVRDPHETLSNLPSQSKASARERKMATQLIEAMAMEWDPHDFRDRTQERVRELVDAKRAGETVEKAEAPPESTNVVDLMSALEASVDQARSSRTGAKRGKKDRAGAGAGARAGSKSGAGAGAGSGSGGKKKPGGKKAAQDLGKLTKDELYRLAGDAGVPGRSRMNRAELEEAVARSSKSAA
jgi:DNA end-binding protein Ku